MLIITTAMAGKFHDGAWDKTGCSFLKPWRRGGRHIPSALLILPGHQTAKQATNKGRTLKNCSTSSLVFRTLSFAVILTHRGEERSGENSQKTIMTIFRKSITPRLIRNSTGQGTLTAW